MFKRLEMEINYVCTYFSRRDHLSPPSFTFRSTLNDTGKVKDLNFGTSIFEHPRNGRKGGEGIRGHFTLGLSNFRQERRFTLSLCELGVLIWEPLMVKH